MILPNAIMMPFIDQKKQYQYLLPKLNLAIQAVLEEGHYILGPAVSALEEALKAYVGSEDVITVANGTDALTLGLMAFGVHSGDVIFVPEFTYCATAGAVARLGAIPYFVDIDPRSYTMCPYSLNDAIQSCIKAGLKPCGVITVDLFGLPANYDAITPIVAEYKLWLMTDTSQAFGAQHNDHIMGSCHTITTTSFYPAKPLGCFGDGGAIFVNNPDMAKLIRSLRVHGQGANCYEHIHIGFNSRLDTLQAAILLVKLQVFDQEVMARRLLADLYDSCLDEIYVRPYIPEYAESVYGQYCIVLPEGVDRNVWQQSMRSQGVPTMIYYPMLMSQQPAYAHFPTAIRPDSYTHALCKRIVALPMHGYMNDSAAMQVIAATKYAKNINGIVI